MSQGGPLIRVKTQRDKHGGETLLLTHGGADGTASVVIYAHRTVPGLRLARHPFDEETIQLLERTYPHLDFDWAKILRAAAASLTGGAPEALGPQRPVRGRPVVADEGAGASRRRGHDGGRSPQPRDARGPGPGAEDEAEADDGHTQAPAIALPVPIATVPDTAPQASSAKPTPIDRGGIDTRTDDPATFHSAESLGPPAAALQSFSAPDDDGADEGGQEEADETREQGAERVRLTPVGRTTTRTQSGSVAERHAALVQRIQQRVRDPQRQAALLAQAAALEPSLWVEPLDDDGATRFEQLHLAIRRQLPSRRRRARRRAPGPGGAGHPSPNPQGDRAAQPERPGE